MDAGRRVEASAPAIFISQRAFSCTRAGVVASKPTFCLAMFAGIAFVFNFTYLLLQIEIIFSQCVELEADHAARGESYCPVCKMTASNKGFCK